MTPVLLFLVLVLRVGAAAAESALPPQEAVASARPQATQVGLGILDQGGNAFDAAVAVSAALAVVEPFGSGLGGGGFWLLHRGADGFEVMVDGRERAPLGAHREMYLDAQGAVVPGLSLDGPLAAGIPGVPAALVHLAGAYGRLPLSRSLAPAIALAREGFAVEPHYRALAASRLAALHASPAAAAQFLVDGAPPADGYLLRQPDLAATLEALARQGRDGFYGGPVAERLVAGVRVAGGIWTLDDLAQYQAVERRPVIGHYQGWRVVSAAPPAAGVLLVAMLNMLDIMDVPNLTGAADPHALVEVMRRAYRDRASSLGDPDQVNMPIARLIAPDYAAGLIRDFDPQRATPSRLADLDCRPADDPPSGTPAEGRQTTHFSILDREGNWVSATLSVNYPFGSGFVPPDTGVLLNDEMDDFSARPGVPNAYGLVGGEANAIAPGKRMLSSMTPTFLESDQGVAILGTPGGSRIPSMVLQGIVSATRAAPVSEWVARPRIHHQFLPDLIEFEPGALTPVEQAALRAMGHRLKQLERPFGNMQAIYWDRRAGRVEAASDPRGRGSAQVR
jgi:gamma-glutamyltranspeptidase / glutathione hydrolase